MQSGIERAAKAAVPLQNDIVDGHDMAAVNGGDAEGMFERVRTQLRVRLGSEVYSSWFGRVALEEASKSVVRLSVPPWFPSGPASLLVGLYRRDQRVPVAGPDHLILREDRAVQAAGIQIR